MALSKSLLHGLGGGSYLTSSSLSSEEKDPLDAVRTGINNAETRINYAGEDAPPQEEGFLSSVLKNLSRTGHGAISLLREFSNPDAGLTPGEFDPLSAFGRGFMLKEKGTGKDVMQDFGMDGTQGIFGGDAKWYNPSAAGAAGLALDILNPLDPINWLTFGVGGAAKTGGLKGTEALLKAFGEEAGNKIAANLGADAVEKLGAPSVGKLMAQVGRAAKESGLPAEGLNDTLSWLKSGLADTGNTATTRLPYYSSRPMTMGLQNPLTLGLQKPFAETAIPGSEAITKPVSRAWQGFMNTRVGDALGKAFSTVHTPSFMPDSVITKDVTGQPELFKTQESNVDNILNNVEDTVKEPNFKYESGPEVYQKARQDLTHLFEQTSHDENGFLMQVEHIFQGIPVEERKKIMEVAATMPRLDEDASKVLDKVSELPTVEPKVPKDTPDFEAGLGLTERGHEALDAFVKWRDSVVKMYTDRQIPMSVLENYVPFIPIRGLKSSEQDALRTVFGTGLKNPAQSSEDELLKALQTEDPNLITRTTQARSPKEVNQLLGKDWLTEDAALAMSIRGVRAIKATQLADFLNGFVDRYGLNAEELTANGVKRSADIPNVKPVTDVPNSIDIGDVEKPPVRDTIETSIPDGYKMYTIDNAGGIKTLKEVTSPTGVAKNEIESFFMPEEMARLYNEYADLIAGGQAKNPLLKVYDNATMAFKKLAYLWNPGHIPRDFVGNVFNGYLMGVKNPKEYIDAASYLMNPDTMIKLPSGEVKAQELIDQAKKYGVLDVGAYAGETPKTVAENLNLPGTNIAQRMLSSYSTLMRKGTQVADTLTRFTGLLNQLQQSKSFMEAAANVKKFYFDYFDLTPFERKVMKRVLPFYTWMRKNVPLQLEMLYRNPREYQRVNDVMSAAEGEPIDPQNRPSYINDSGAFKLGSNGDYISPSLPFTDINKLPTSADALRQYISGVNPLIRAPIESATNTQWFSGRPLESYQGETRDMPLAGLLKYLGVDTSNLPRISKRTTGELIDQLPLVRNIDLMTNPDNPDKQVSRFSSFLGGPSVYSNESVQKSKLYEDKRRLEDFIKKLNDEGTSVSTIRELQKAGKIPKTSKSKSSSKVQSKWAHLGGG